MSFLKEKIPSKDKAIIKNNDYFLAFMELIPDISASFEIYGEIKNNTIHLAKVKASKLEKTHYSGFTRKNSKLSRQAMPAVNIAALCKAQKNKDGPTICKDCYESTSVFGRHKGFSESAPEDLALFRLKINLEFAILDTYKIYQYLQEEKIPNSLEEITAEKIISMWENYKQAKNNLESSMVGLDFKKAARAIYYFEPKDSEKQILCKIQEDAQMLLKNVHTFLSDKKTKGKILELFPDTKAGHPCFESLKTDQTKRIVFGQVPEYQNVVRIIKETSSFKGVGKGDNYSETLKDLEIIAALLNILQVGKASFDEKKVSYYAYALSVSKASRLIDCVGVYENFIIRSTHCVSCSVIECPDDITLDQEILDLSLIFWENTTARSETGFMEAINAAAKLQ